MIKVAFVILNYESTLETIKCIQAILKLEYENKDIVVVDNASKDSQELWK